MSDKKTSVFSHHANTTINRKEWKMVRLGEVAQICRGGSPRPIQNYLTNNANGINWIKIGDVAVGAKYIERTEEKITPEGESKSRRVFPGDFLLSNSMSFGRPYILKIGGCIHDGWLAIQNYHASFCTDYLYYVLGSDVVFAQYMESAAGSSVKNLNKEVVADLMMPRPSLDEQRAIASSLSAIDEHIAALRRLIAKQEMIKKSTLKMLLQPKEGMPLVSIGEAFFISGGVNASREQLGKTGLCYLHYGDIHSSTKTLIDVDTEYSCIPKLNIAVSKISSHSLLSDGDVVFVDASEDDDGTSRYVVIRNKTKTPFIAGLHTIVAKQKGRIFDNSFLAYVFSCKFVKMQFVHYAVGTKVSGVNKKSIQQILIPCPPLTQQKRIGRQLAAIDSILPPLHSKLKKAEQIKAGMMRHFFG